MCNNDAVNEKNITNISNLSNMVISVMKWFKIEMSFTKTLNIFSILIANNTFIL